MKKVYIVFLTVILLIYFIITFFMVEYIEEKSPLNDLFPAFLVKFYMDSLIFDGAERTVLFISSSKEKKLFSSCVSNGMIKGRISSFRNVKHFWFYDGIDLQVESCYFHGNTNGGIYTVIIQNNKIYFIRIYM